MPIPEPDLAAGSVRRLVRVTEPENIAQVALAGGGRLKVHGNATHYSQEWVTVARNDDNIHHFDCRTPASDVRPPTQEERRGMYVQF